MLKSIKYGLSKFFSLIIQIKAKYLNKLFTYQLLSNEE